MYKDLEAARQQYIPKTWTKKNIASFIGNPRFASNTKTINEALNKPLQDFLSRGGKRIRPLLFLTLLKGFNKNPKHYLDVALVIELIHNGTLILDDIEDRSTLRRGQPALHSIFGTDIALNTGSALLIAPLKLLIKNPHLTNKQLLELLKIYSEEVTRVHFGQAIDISWHNAIPENITVKQYLEMVRLKTGALMRMSTRFACAIAGKEKQFTAQLSTFIEDAGIAFQIKDDALEYTADPTTFGKAYGNDITEGKISLPILLALKELPPAKQKKLLHILKQHTHNKKLLKQAQNFVTSTSAIPKSLALAEQILITSWERIEPQLPAGQCRTTFQALVTSFITRKY